MECVHPSIRWVSFWQSFDTCLCIQDKLCYDKNLIRSKLERAIPPWPTSSRLMRIPGSHCKDITIHFWPQTHDLELAYLEPQVRMAFLWIVTAQWSWLPLWLEHQNKKFRVWQTICKNRPLHTIPFQTSKKEQNMHAEDENLKTLPQVSNVKGQRTSCLRNRTTLQSKLTSPGRTFILNTFSLYDILIILCHLKDSIRNLPW